MDDICTRVGFSIRKQREGMGISQEKLAELSELHRTYIGQCCALSVVNLTLFRIMIAVHQEDSACKT
jgi:predicted transcriptional regulator